MIVLLLEKNEKRIHDYSVVGKISAKFQFKDF